MRKTRTQTWQCREKWEKIEVFKYIFKLLNQNKLSMFPDLYIYESQHILFNIYVTFTGFLFCFVFVVIWKIKIHYCICRRPGFDSWVKKISWRREWLPTLVFLPGEFHGQRSLVSYSPWGHIESDMSERLTHTYTHTHTHTEHSTDKTRYISY